MTPPAGASPVADPVLQAIVSSALEATGATDGWLAAVDAEADVLVVVAAAGPAGRALLGVTVDDDEGFSGLVVGSGQPVALAPADDDPRFGDGLATRLGRRPRTLLCVPCEDDDIVLGAIELVDKGDGGFSYEDLELATVLGHIAASVLRTGAGGRSAVPTPMELGQMLDALAASDPVRYALVADLVAAVVRRD